MIQELRYEGLQVVRSVKPEGDKKTRLTAQTATIENGFVHLPKDAPWLPDYVAEMTSFPMAKHDDQIDSTSQVLGWQKNDLWKSGMGVFNYMKDLRERRLAEVQPVHGDAADLNR